MSDIVAFLLARLDEDQRRAKGSGTVAWLTFRHADGSMRYTSVASGQPSGVWIIDGAEATDYSSAQVIYEEARVLAEIAAKRRIVDESLDADRDAVNADSELLTRPTYEDGIATGYECVLTSLALPYVDHPDYQQEWKP